MKKDSVSHQYGKLAENKALEFLRKQKLCLLERNYRTPHGEIDLIMRDKEVLVFIEVRARNNNDFLEAIETIDIHKRKRIVKASEHYLQRYKIKSPCRLDAITLAGSLDESKINWIKNAFEA